MKRSHIHLLIGLGLFIFGCSGPGSADKKQVVNVYSHRHYDVDRELFQKFEETTGIQVNVIKANADELIVRLENEGSSSPADVLVTVDAGRLYLAREKQLLQPIELPSLLNQVPTSMLDPDGYWLGLTYRARVIVYATDRMDSASLRNYADLASPALKGRLLMRSSENIYNQSLLASIIASEGEEAARAFSAGLVDNMARQPKGNDTDQMKAVYAGLGDVTVVNSYYLGKLLQSNNPEDVAAAKSLTLVYPNQDNRGTHINITGAGIARYAPNRENALKFLSFLLSESSQTFFAEANFEYPAVPSASPSPAVQQWGPFVADTLPLHLLGEYNNAAVRIMNETGWK